MDDIQECKRWCRLYGLLAKQMVYPTLNHYCREQALDSSVGCVTWRCPVKTCKKRISIKNGRFFEKLHLKLQKILGLTYLRCRSAGKSRGVSVADVLHELQIGSEDSMVDWNNFLARQPLRISQIILFKLETLEIKLRQTRFIFQKKIQSRENSTETVDFWTFWSCNQGKRFVAIFTLKCCYFDASHRTVGQPRSRNLE